MASKKGTLSRFVTVKLPFVILSFLLQLPIRAMKFTTLDLGNGMYFANQSWNERWLSLILRKLQPDDKCLTLPFIIWGRHQTGWLAKYET